MAAKSLPEKWARLALAVSGAFFAIESLLCENYLNVARILLGVSWIIFVVVLAYDNRNGTGKVVDR